MPNLICIGSVRVGWPEMSLPQHLSVAVSPLEECRWPPTFARAGSLNMEFHIRAHSLGSDTPFSDLSPQGFQCTAEHQLCWDSHYFFDVMVSLHFTFYMLLSSLDSQEIHLENLVHIFPHARGQFSCLSCSAPSHFSAWKIPWAHSSMRSQCKDLVWFILKRPSETLLNQPASGWNETPNTSGFVSWKKIKSDGKKKDEAPSPNLFPSRVLTMWPKPPILSVKNVTPIQGPWKESTGELLQLVCNLISLYHFPLVDTCLIWL